MKKYDKMELKRFICVPLSKDAVIRFNLDKCINGDLMELKLNENNFKQAWETGLFDSLNNELDLLIDDYEEEEITDFNKLNGAKNIIKNYLIKYKDILLLNDIMDLINAAIRNETGVYFFFTPGIYNLMK